MPTIADRIGYIWPVTESKLSDTVTGYPDIRDNAVRRATAELYGTVTPPEEAEIPDIAQDWIADRACLMLIPVAVDFYMNYGRQADTKEGATISYLDKLGPLENLKRELTEAVAANRDAALDAIDAAKAPERVTTTPAVSIGGMMIDPWARAYTRGNI